MAETRWVTLGTCGGPFQQPEAFQISNALVVGDDVYLFDVGNGVLRRLEEYGIGVGRVRGAFLTHHHPDHIADLGIVMLTHWLTPGSRRLPIAGPTGTAHLVDGLSSAYEYTELTEETGKGGIAERVSVHEATAGGNELTELYRDDTILVEAIDVAHFQSREPRGSARPHAIGLRITTDDRVIAYTGDTGPTPTLVNLARDADLLVSEVVDVPRIIEGLHQRFGGASETVERVEYNMRHNHLPPAEIGRVAASAGARSLLLTHFVPLPTPVTAEELAREAGESGVPVTVASDLGSY